MPPSSRQLAAKYHMRLALKAATTHALSPEGEARAEPRTSGAHAPEIKQRERWAPDVKRAFDRMAPHALVVVGTPGPVSATIFNAAGEEVQRLGGNRGVWPMRLALSSAWKDTVTMTYNRSPFCAIGTLIRCWCETDAHARQLAGKVLALLESYREHAWGETLQNGWIDVGPEIQVPMLEMEIHAQAQALGFSAWDDAGLVEELERRARSRAKVGGW